MPVKKTDWMDMMSGMEGAINERSDPWARPLRSLSPSFNQMFGHTHGLPRGYSMLLWGKPGSGKSLTSFSFAGGIHQNSPDDIVVKFDTEFRDEGQLTPEMAKAYGIDFSRYKVFAVSDPAMVFDRIKNELGPMVEAGMPLSLIIIDSINGVQGRLEALNDEVDDGEGGGKKKKKKTGVKQFRIGDNAQTNKIGLKSILPIQRAPGRQRISLIVTAHVAAEMDMWEQKRGNKEKAAVSFGVQHHCEFFVNVYKDLTAAGKKDAFGNDMIDTSRKSMDGSGETTGQKIGAWMQKSSMSTPDRVSKFTFDYRRGVINTAEEIVEMGTNWGIIKIGGSYYTIGNQRFNGYDNAVRALEASPEMRAKVLSDLIAAEATGSVPAAISAPVIAPPVAGEE
jgi:hypothetical protein